jgi:hypothetical protein
MRQNYTGNSLEESRAGSLDPAEPLHSGKALHAAKQDSATSASRPPKTTPSSKPPLARFDRPGHISKEHASRLWELSHTHARRSESDRAFDSASGDDLANELGELAVASMVGGGETWLDVINAPSEEEEGGPFLETRSAREFGVDPEEDLDGFLREALPTSSAARQESEIFVAKRRGR